MEGKRAWNRPSRFRSCRPMFLRRGWFRFAGRREAHRRQDVCSPASSLASAMRVTSAPEGNTVTASMREMRWNFGGKGWGEGGGGENDDGETQAHGRDPPIGPPANELRSSPHLAAKPGRRHSKVKTARSPAQNVKGFACRTCGKRWIACSTAAGTGSSICTRQIASSPCACRPRWKVAILTPALPSSMPRRR